MMEVEDEHILVGEEIGGRVLLMANDVTATDETTGEVEEVRVAFLIVKDVFELLVCLVSGLHEGDDVAVGGECGCDEPLHELIVVGVEDERGAKCSVSGDGEV
jgi:hypothetical protein